MKLNSKMVKYMSSSEAPAAKGGDAFAELEALSEKFLAACEQALQDGTTEQISDEVLQRVMTGATKVFANKTEMEERFFLPFTSPEACTPTDVVVGVSEMLRAVNLNTFDLAMWFRRPRPDDSPI